jgi:hypothetical protein
MANHMKPLGMLDPGCKMWEDQLAFATANLYSAITVPPRRRVAALIVGLCRGSNPGHMRGSLAALTAQLSNTTTTLNTRES